MNDDELHSLIRQTQPKPEFPASFQREVWARITVAEQHSLASRFKVWSGALLLWIGRPAPAFATVLITVGLGVAFGSLNASDSKTAMRIAYADSINPFKMSQPPVQE